MESNTGFFQSSICILILVLIVNVSGSYFEALDDTILHKIKWEGELLPDIEQEIQNEAKRSIQMNSARGEQYLCILPKPQDLSKEETQTYAGPNPFEIISPLFNQFVCTFKLETYWTYELCHGKYIRQYHEEREGKKVKLQEYYLGRWDKEDMQKAKTQVEADFADPRQKPTLPIKKIEGVNMPALQLNLTDGTMCDLNGQPRNTRVMYVCDPRGKHELYSLEEVSTCEYEIVVLSPLICQHPDFKSKEVGENLISCYSVGDTPQMPRALTELETESLKLKHEHLLQNFESLLERNIRSETKTVDSDGDSFRLKDAIFGKPASHDAAFLAAFFDGKDCLTGGTHWWKFEFCYGKHVIQYHEEHEGGSRTTIVLGKWNEANHRDWLDKNPHKKPTVSGLRKSLYHFYSGGAQCDQTGQPRSVEVKLKCVDAPNHSAVSLYLLEPKTCEYSLTVESPLFCHILDKATSDYGMIDTSEYITKPKFKKSGGSSSFKNKFNTQDEHNLLNNDDAQGGV